MAPQHLLTCNPAQNTPLTLSEGGGETPASTSGLRAETIETETSFAPWCGSEAAELNRGELS